MATAAAGAELPVARTRCMSFIAADGLTAKRRAAARIELALLERARSAAADPKRSGPA
jgi:hypothetical protein